MIEKGEGTDSKIEAADIGEPKRIIIVKKPTESVEKHAEIEKKPSVSVVPKTKNKPVRKSKEVIAREVVKQEGDKLSPKERLFVAEYIICLNGSEAARRAGYSARSAKEIASKLLTKIHIARAIEEGRRRLELQAEVDALWVIRGLKETAERCLQRKPVMVLDYEEKCLVQKVDENGNHVWEFDSAGANKAFESIGKHLGMFKPEAVMPFLPGATIVINPPAEARMPRQLQTNAE